MSECQYIRNGRTIIERKVTEDGHDTTEKHTHPSLNQAKKKSRELQMKNDGALGQGCLRVHSKR